MGDNDDIPFDARTDRELLVMSLMRQKSNGDKITALADRFDRMANNHGKRIRSLENWRLGLGAAWAALSGALAVLAAWVRSGVNLRIH